MTELLPRLRLPVAEGEGPLDLAGLFEDLCPEDFWLEIGFGAGEHLAWQAAQNPKIAMLGAEPFVNGVARILAHIRDAGLKNVRLWDGDARDLLERLPDGAIGRAFILHPDPWPKRRHWKRRIVNAETLEALKRVLRPGAELRVASDIPDYIDWTLIQVTRAGGFEWLAEKAEDWRERPADWPQTRYEAKAAREGRKALYLRFRRM